VGEIGGEQVRDGSLTGADVQDESLTGADILNGSLLGEDVADGTLGILKLQGILPTSARQGSRSRRTAPAASCSAG